MRELIMNLWKFFRDDMTVSDFEQWVYKTPELENVLGVQLYFETVACNYHDLEKVWQLKQLLKSAVDLLDPQQCHCSIWKDNQKIPISLDSGWELINEAFVALRKRTPWLTLSRCSHCGQYWYVALDNIEDDYYLHRLKNEEAQRIITNNDWPLVFDGLKAVWPSKEWLILDGNDSLGDWQIRNND